MQGQCVKSPSYERQKNRQSLCIPLWIMIETLVHQWKVWTLLVKVLHPVIWPVELQHQGELSRRPAKNPLVRVQMCAVCFYLLLEAIIVIISRIDWASTWGLSPGLRRSGGERNKSERHLPSTLSKEKLTAWTGVAKSVPQMEANRMLGRLVEI